MIEIKKGSQRWVILTKRFAFKIPSLESWRGFLYGLISNMQEVDWSGFSNHLCPVLFSLPGGFLVTMPRVNTLSEDNWDENLIQANYILDSEPLPVELKPSSWGYLNDRLVAVDYGL